MLLSPNTNIELPAHGGHRRFCVAPMMDWTDRHYRFFARLISRKALLYTEMITTGALIHGDRARFLEYHRDEQPLAIQLGGSDPRALATCAVMAEDSGYREINLNVGCPSDRVQNNMIGACLMAHPDLVAECISSMQNAVAIPVTVKHRIGIDELTSYEHLYNFVNRVADAGCKTFIVHARIALLQGLSPKQNREIPPLEYETVYRLKRDFPELEIVINGGITSIDACKSHLAHLDGTMIGREAYHNPWLLSEVDNRLYGETTNELSRIEVLEAMIPYVEKELLRGTYLGHMTRHILGLFHGQPGGRKFRRLFSEEAHRPGADIELLKKAITMMNSESTRAKAYEVERTSTVSETTSG
ncbi:MAG: tRNA dihydrouridine(20/20a) synthase DusA [Hahellaceae bacterium]|nr:tRNA dihydrouridine(20/20a) synthase DusA [Hahellaceae bacterium]